MRLNQGTAELGWYEEDTKNNTHPRQWMRSKTESRPKLEFYINHQILEHLSL